MEVKKNKKNRKKVWKPINRFQKKMLFDYGYRKSVIEFIKNISNNKIHDWKKSSALCVIIIKILKTQKCHTFSIKH